jgi:hypothetical protein
MPSDWKRCLLGWQSAILTSSATLNNYLSTMTPPDIQNCKSGATVLCFLWSRLRSYEICFTPTISSIGDRFRKVAWQHISHEKCEKGIHRSSTSSWCDLSGYCDFMAYC